MGSVKCSQAIENSIVEDCFKVPSLERVFETMISNKVLTLNIENNQE